MSGDNEISVEIDTAWFVGEALSFSCFAQAKAYTGEKALFDLILDSYQSDLLTEEQDMVVECLLHLQDENSPFNLNRALAIWEPEDLSCFINLVKAKR
jgi:hypothetical protein